MATSSKISKVVYSELKDLPYLVLEGDKPLRTEADYYISINVFSLNNESLQRFVVNVNCHAKDQVTGAPYLDKFDEMEESVMTKLVKYTNNTELLRLNFDKDETIKEQDLDKHYRNLRFIASQINFET